MKKALVKKSGSSKKNTAAKKNAGDIKKQATKRAASKRTSRQKKEPRPYVMPKTAAEIGITCQSPAPGADGICGKPVIWFDYELGEKRHMQGFVCDVHKVSNRVEKLAMPENLS